MDIFFNIVIEKLTTSPINYHSDQNNNMHVDFEDLPIQVKGLMTVDKWGIHTFRTFKKRKHDIIGEPP